MKNLNLMKKESLLYIMTMSQLLVAGAQLMWLMWLNTLLQDLDLFKRNFT